MKILASAAALIIVMSSSVGFGEDGSATYATETGDLTVTYGQTAPRDYGTRPGFATLDEDANGSIDTSEARAYGLLDVDFDHADQNRNGSVSAREFARWPRNQ